MMTPTQAPPPPELPPSSPRSTPPPPALAASYVWASLILDVAALAAIVLLAKWHVFSPEVTTSALFVILTGRVVAKAGRNNGAGGGGFSSIGGVAAIATSVYTLLYRGHGGA